MEQGTSDYCTLQLTQVVLTLAWQPFNEGGQHCIIKGPTFFNYKIPVLFCLDRYATHSSLNRIFERNVGNVLLFQFLEQVTFVSNSIKTEKNYLLFWKNIFWGEMDWRDGKGRWTNFICRPELPQEATGFGSFVLSTDMTLTVSKLMKTANKQCIKTSKHKVSQYDSSTWGNQ